MFIIFDLFGIFIYRLYVVFSLFSCLVGSVLWYDLVLVKNDNNFLELLFFISFFKFWNWFFSCLIIFKIYVLLFKVIFFYICVLLLVIWVILWKLLVVSLLIKWCFWLFFWLIWIKLDVMIWGKWFMMFVM